MASGFRLSLPGARSAPAFFRFFAAAILTAQPKAAGSPGSAWRAERGGSWNNHSDKAALGFTTGITRTSAATELGCTAYLRYVDDFALFDDDKARLNAWGAEVKSFLARRLRLRVHENSAQVLPCRCGIPWLGFVVFPDHRRVKSRKVVAATRRLGQRYDAWCAGEISFADFNASVQGWINHVRFADSWGLRESVFDRFPLQGRPFSLAGN